MVTAPPPLYNGQGRPGFPFAITAINITVQIYENHTPSGLNFHLSLDRGVCYIMVHDLYDTCYFEMRYFTNVNLALRWINNL